MANISKTKAVELILKEVQEGKTYTDTLEQFLTKFNVSNPTFATYWKEANKIYQNRLKKKEEARTQREIAKAIHELETQDGQVNALIVQLNEVKAELESGMTIDCAWNRGQFVETQRILNATERKDRRLLCIKLLAEIRSIRGLDAPKQSQVKLETDIDKLIKAGDAKVEEGEGTTKPFKSLKGE